MSKAKTTVIDGPQGSLEAMIVEKEAAKVVVIICHPHPLKQGTMHNKVLYMLSRAFSGLGATTIRFNYRGVGKSTGTYGHGEGETDDLRAVMTWSQYHHPQCAIWLVGFSFGCYVVGNAVNRYPTEVEQLLMVAPAVELLDFNSFAPFSCPTSIVHGDHDEVADYHLSLAWQTEKQPSAQWIAVEGADHFFHGRLLDLESIVFNVFNAKMSR